MPDPAPEAEFLRSRPVALVDHAILNVRRGMDAAADAYRRLGFTLTPLGRHTVGTVNHLAMFGTDYLELMGAPPEMAARTDMPDWPEGLAGLVFATHDADATYAALAQAGAPVLPPLAFSRPVALPGGPRDAAFRIVRVAREASPAGRMFFCGHLTREVVWRDEWRRHPNGALGIAELVIAVADPAPYATLFAALFGLEAVIEEPDGLRLPAGLATVRLATPEAVVRRFGGAAPADVGSGSRMAALVLRVARPARTADLLDANGVAGVARTEAGVVVPADQALGATLVFAAT